MKWKNVRDHFRKTLQGPKSGAAAKKTKYMYADALEFLLSASEKRRFVFRLRSFLQQSNRTVILFTALLVTFPSTTKRSLNHNWKDTQRPSLLHLKHHLYLDLHLHYPLQLRLLQLFIQPQLFQKKLKCRNSNPNF